ncbi:MAG: hypothetical protein KIT73_08690 [Burkholderiales bacterium]|nr:hypothetical protein [Burkholderiales bacterium]
MTRDRDSSFNRQMRHRIAHLAARLMAEDGIEDFGFAKRKAARQAGAPDTRNLPDNEEIEEALRTYQQLYQAEEHAERLIELRAEALVMMRALAAFDPHLVGPVLSGSAARYADIDLQLFTDSVKDVELFLINRRIPYRSREARYWVGEEARSVPSFELDTPAARFDVAVFEARDLRQPLRSSPDGRPIERARADWLEKQTAAPVGIPGTPANG